MNRTGLPDNEYRVLRKLYDSRTGTASLIGEEADAARRMCFDGLVTGYELGRGVFFASIRPAGSLTITESIFFDVDGSVPKPA